MRKHFDSTRAGLLLTLLTSVGACVEPAPVETGPDAALLLLTQRVQPSEVLEAQFRGRVEVDQAGCLRLADAEPSTVIWPFGASLARDNASLIVLDSDGHTLVRIGHLVSLGGGVVTQLAALNVLAEDMLAAALSRCPGSYWLVGAVG